MAQESTTDIKEYAYILYGILRKIRYEGLLSVESLAESPEQTPLLAPILGEPDQVFLCDSLSVIINGATEPEQYAFYARNALTSDKAMFLYSSLWISLSGCSSEMAIEFGRQSLGAKAPFSRAELKEWMIEWQKNLMRTESTL